VTWAGEKKETAVSKKKIRANRGRTRAISAEERRKKVKGCPGSFASLKKEAACVEKEGKYLGKKWLGSAVTKKKKRGVGFYIKGKLAQVS